MVTWASHSGGVGSFLDPWEGLQDVGAPGAHGAPRGREAGFPSRVSNIQMHLERSIKDTIRKNVRDHLANSGSVILLENLCVVGLDRGQRGGVWL